MWLATVCLFCGIFTVTSFNFTFQLTSFSVGLEAFPSIFDDSIRDLAGRSLVPQETITRMTLEGLVKALTNIGWEPFLKDYFTGKNIASADLKKIRVKSLQDLTEAMPRYSLKDFWNVPLKVLIFQISKYLTQEGMNDVLTLLEEIYKHNPRFLLAEIQGFEFSRAYLFHGYPLMKQIMEKLQYNETDEFMKRFRVSVAQLTFLTHALYDTVNRKMSLVLFSKMHAHNATNHVIEVKKILKRVELFHASFQHWSLACAQGYDSKDTLDVLSESCFSQPFTRTASVLYNVQSAHAQIFKTLTVNESRMLANPIDTSLQPVSKALAKMRAGLNNVTENRNQLYVLMVNDHEISLREMNRFTISETLTRVHSLPWTLLKKLYKLKEHVAVKVKSIPFDELTKLVNGENAGVDVTTNLLQLLSLDAMFRALAGNASKQFIELEFKKSLTKLNQLPLFKLQSAFHVSNASLATSSLQQFTSHMFAFQESDFITEYSLTTAQFHFFNASTIKDIKTLLKLEDRDFKMLSMVQTITEINKQIKYSPLMLLTPASLAAGKRLSEIAIFSIPQLVHMYRASVLSQDFVAHIADWSKSSALSLMLKEKDLKEISAVLTRPVESVANMRLLDIILAVQTTFGSKCSAGSLYCRKLQECQLTDNNEHRCQCQSGYRFSEPDVCADLNECLYAKVTCDEEHGACENTQGSYRCKCKPGFTGDGHTCYNVNECSTNQYKCVSNSRCVDTVGSYKCVCNDGFFIKDDSTCNDKNECALNTHDCHSNAVCSNTVGGFYCLCKVGYAGDGKRACHDINECRNNLFKCPPNSWCQNTIGSYLCRCRYGFFEDKGYCQQCSEKRHTCHEFADCYREVFDNFRCVCKAGFVGNGTTCADYNECVKDNPCKNGKCRNFIGGHSCLCNRGFKSNIDNKFCLDVDECSESSKVGVTLCNVTDAVCVNREGSYACVTYASNNTAKTVLAVFIPLVVVLAIVASLMYFFYRKTLGNRELSSFDHKLKAMHVNHGYTASENKTTTESRQKQLRDEHV